MTSNYYLPNKDLLVEIHKSKVTFCSFTDRKHADFDFIVSGVGKTTPGFLVVPSIEAITPEILEEVRQKKAAKLTKSGTPSVAEDFPINDLIFRLMTDEHIPIDPNRKKRGKTGEQRAKTAFPSFKHFVWNDGNPQEVCRSHWRGDFTNGTFDPERGKINNRLASMFMLLSERYGRHHWYRNYSYNDDMKGHALVQLTQNGLQFCESKSDNPFSFYTTTIKHCFMRVKKDEEKVKRIRDELMISAGAAPSMSRQLENELEFREELDGGYARATGAEKKTRGRKPKARTIDDE